MRQLKGSIVAMVTPMKTDGEIDFNALEKFIEWQIESGTSGLIPVGTTGESAVLSMAEKKAVISFTVKSVAGRIPVIAGTGSNNTADAVVLTQYAAQIGADAALLVSPYYNKPGDEGIFQHYKHIHDAADLPLIIYNVPGRTNVDIKPELVARLSRLARVIGIKDASADLSRVTLHSQICDQGFLQFSGDDFTALGFNAMGGHGAMTVFGNIAPKSSAALQEATLNGNFEYAREIQAKFNGLIWALFQNTSPSPVKYGASLLGYGTPFVRLPLVEADRNVKARVKDEMVKTGLLEEG